MLNSCRNCLRSRVYRLRDGTQHREYSERMTALTTSRPRLNVIQAAKLDSEKVQLVEKMEREIQLELLTAERSVFDLMNEESVGNTNSMKVYRLLRAEEDPEEGLYPKIIHCLDGIALQTSVVQHIETGSRSKSRFISTSKRLDACLFYASKSTHERDTNSEDLRIAKIELDLSQGNVLDLTDKQIRMKQGMKKGSKAYNYAKCFDEVIVDRCISADEIVNVFQIPGLPSAKTYALFKEQLRSLYMLS